MKEEGLLIEPEIDQHHFEVTLNEEEEQDLMKLRDKRG